MKNVNDQINQRIQYSNKMDAEGSRFDGTMTLARCCIRPSDLLWGAEPFRWDGQGVIKGQLSPIKRPVWESLCWQHHSTPRLLEKQQHSASPGSFNTLPTSPSSLLVSAEMEVALLCLSAALLALCPGALSLPQGIDRASPSPSPGPGILSSSRRVPYPLYMMQLYRSFQTGDPTAAPGAGGAPGTGGDRPSSQSDSVLSLMAQGELMFVWLLYVFYFSRYFHTT